MRTYHTHESYLLCFIFHLGCIAHTKSCEPWLGSMDIFACVAMWKRLKLYARHYSAFGNVRIIVISAVKLVWWHTGNTYTIINSDYFWWFLNTASHFPPASMIIFNEIKPNTTNAYPSTVAHNKPQFVYHVHTPNSYWFGMSEPISRLIHIHMHTDIVCLPALTLTHKYWKKDTD